MPTQRPAAAPLLETARLRLRGLTGDDFAHMHALRQDEAIYQYITGRPATEEESWSRLMRALGHWQIHGFGYWAMTLKTTGEFIGEAGIANLHREMAPSLDGFYEAGWTTRTSLAGNGYAREAMMAIFNWAAAQLEPLPFAAMTTPDNIRSLRLAHRLGFSEFARSAHRGDAVLLLKRPFGPAT